MTKEEAMNEAKEFSSRDRFGITYSVYKKKTEYVVSCYYPEFWPGDSKGWRLIAQFHNGNQMM